MKNLQFNPYQSGAGRGVAWRGRTRRVGSKKCKPIPAPPQGARLKSPFIPTPPPLRDDKNPLRAMRGRTGQAGQSKIVIPNVTF